MTKAERDKCRAIIHGSAVSGAAAAALMAQAPCSDNAVLVGIEVAMTISLGAVFGVTVTRSVATSTVVGSTATMAGRSVFQLMCGWLPCVGNAANAATAFALIEAMGWAVASDFSNQHNRGLQ